MRENQCRAAPPFKPAVPGQGRPTALRGGVERLRVPGRFRRAFIALGAAPSFSVFGTEGRAG